ncbi:porin [Inhella gelatinilytica]|uniref:Porin n=1 Tax=Inhella gelatinilytica TaxID=2795030 RepID=A0A931NFU8_9BURK|nr:porin [Inhella gelatinilytica]MBH9553911.1 porin [Inhella gelatinilytica]
MKKFALSAVALVAAAVAAPAFAQSSVTLYGRVNTTVENQKVNNGSRTWVVQNNSSRFGLKGTEDIGGGLKASFNLESGFNSDTGAAASTFWGREAWVQLAGSFGAIRLGNITPESYFATADYVSMHNHDTGPSSDALYGGPFLNKNKVMYMLPAMGGFSMSVAMTAGEKVVKNGTDIGANYDAGPMHLGFGYSKQGAQSQWAARGLFEMGPVTLGGYFQRNDLGATTQNIWRLAGMYASGASEFHVNLGAANKGPKAGQWTLGYNYNLSKRTKVYTYYTKYDLNKDTAAADAEFSSLAFGVRHNF